jgi:catechol 2,3-dioxygenase-like lactoylglutathione lyase family enzyme
VLGNHPVHPVLLAKDLAAARHFYHDQVGLEIIVERGDDAIEFRTGSTKITVSKSTTGTADSQTQLAWEVDDLAAELDELRARGVKIEDYDLPGLRTENGIADIGFALMAWIVDPGSNALAIMEHK